MTAHTPTQADRDAAVKVASLTRCDGEQMWAINDGKADDHPFVQAFAAHRINSHNNLVEALEAACTAIFEAGLTADNTEAYLNGRRALAAAKGDAL